MDPIVFTNPAWIDNVAQVVFGVGYNKVGVADCIVAVARICLVGQRNPGSLLGCIDGSRSSCEASKTFIEIVEPPAQVHARIPSGIGGDKDERDLSGYTRGQFLQGRADTCHVQGTLRGAMRIAEKQERDCPPGSVEKIKRSTGGVSEDEMRFRQGRRYQAAPVVLWLIVNARPRVRQFLCRQ